MKKKKIVLYYIEYTESIKFFGDNEKSFEVLKIDRNYNQVQNLLNDSRFTLKNLI